MNTVTENYRNYTLFLALEKFPAAYTKGGLYADVWRIKPAKIVFIVHAAAIITRTPRTVNLVEPKQPDPRLETSSSLLWPQLYLFHVEHKAGNQRNHRKYRQHRTNCSAHERCLRYMHLAVVRADPSQGKVWLVSNSTHHINTHLAKYSRVPA